MYLYDAVNGVGGDDDDVLLGSVTTTDGTYRFLDPRDSTSYFVRFQATRGTTSGSSLPLLAPTRQGLDSDIDASGRSAVFGRGIGGATVNAGFQEAPLTLGGWGIGGTDLDAGSALALDAAGNVYVAGTFSGTVDFDPRSGTKFLTSAGGSDGFVTKYTPAGALLWARRLGGSGDDFVPGLAVDAKGYVHVTGSFAGTADFGPNSENRNSAGNRDAFVLKLSPDGDFVWVKQMGGTDDVSPRGIALDESGCVYTTGNFTGSAPFNGPVVNRLHSPNGKIYVSKLNAAGNYVWARQLGSTGASVKAIAANPAGDVYLAGDFTGTVDFDPGAGSTTRSSSTPSAFVATLNNAGIFRWAREFVGDTSVAAKGLALDAKGSAIVVGVFRGTADFNPDPSGNYLLSSAGGTDIFVTKLTAGGVFDGATATHQGGSDENVHGVVAGSSSSVFLTGDDAFGGFIQKLDGSGEHVFTAPFAGTASAVAVDAGGTVYATGSFQDTSDFDPGAGTFTVASAGMTDAFVLKVTWGIVQGRVWIDRDGNGIQDAGDPGLGGAAVELFRSSDGVRGNGDDVLVGIQTAAGDGLYRFQGAASGPGYYVRVRPPAGPTLAFTGQDEGSNDAIDSDVNADGVSGLFDADALAPTAVDVGLTGSVPAFGIAWTSDGPGDSEARASRVDADGNVYVTGKFQGSIDFAHGLGEVGLASTANSYDAFVAKYSSAGALLWVRGLGGAGDDAGLGIATDALGFVYTVGYFRGSADFNPGADEYLRTSSGYDAFVSKLDASGNFVWVKHFGGSGDDFAYAVAVAEGTVAFVGSFQGTVDFGLGPAKPDLVSLGTRDAFVCKLNADGNTAWAQKAGGAGSDDAANGVAVDAAGAVYVAGAFGGTADFDPSTGVLDLASRGPRDAFAWKLDANGALVWARNAGGTGDDAATAVALGANERVLVTGWFSGTADFDPGAGRLELHSAGGSDAFVWALTSAGGLGWARALGGPGTEAGAAVATDATGVYVAGSFQQTADFDPSSGVLPLDSAGGTDAFLVRLTAAGDRQWAHRLGGAGNDSGCGIAVDSVGRVTAVGGFIDRATFDPGDGDQSLTGGSASNLFVARIDPPVGVAVYRLDAYEPAESRLAAADLGVINQTRTIDGLTLHAAGDRDWFRFELLSDGQPGNRVRIDLATGSGDVDLELYHGAQLVATTTTSADANAVEQIELTGLPAGVYYARVFGATSPGYRLIVATPPAYPRDAYEPNDTAAVATPLGTLDTPTTVPGLTVHAAGEADWFAFTTVADGTLASRVRIDFRNAEGDLDLELYDADGTLLRTSTGTDDAEAVSLAGLAAGTYLVRVYGHAGAINPAYALTVVPPRPLVADALEPNETRDGAHDLGPVTGRRIRDGLSVSTALDQDWFRFTTAARGAAGHLVAIEFVNAEGDLDLRLYDAAGTLVGSSATSGDGEQVSLQGQPAGVYYAQVVGAGGATQPAYRLTVVAPTGSALPADRLEGVGGNDSRTTAAVVRTEGQTYLAGQQTLADLSLHARGDQDWFRFTTAAKGAAGHRLVLGYQPADGNLDLELYNAAGTRLQVSQGAGGTEVVSLAGLPATTYYARVYSPLGTVAGYRLTFDTPPAPAAPVVDDWTILVYMTADNLVNRAKADLNEMEAAAAALPGSVNLAVLLDQSSTVETFPTGNGSQAAWGATGRALVTPDTDPTRIATWFQRLSEQNTGDGATLRSFVEWATAAAPARHYALVLWNHGKGLLGANVDRKDGAPADYLTAAEIAAALAGQPRMEVVAFDACQMGVAEVAHALRGVTDVVVGSQDQNLGDGFEYDQAFAPLLDEPSTVTAEALATGLVQSYGRRYGSTGAADTLAAIRTAGLDALATALGGFAAAVGQADREAVVAAAVAALVPTPAADYQRDLGGFLAAVAAQPGVSAALEEAARSATAALGQAVLSKTADRRNSSGLSVYLPGQQANGQSVIDPNVYPGYADAYPAFAAATGWAALLADLATAGGGRADELDEYDAAARNDTLSAASDLKRLVGSGHLFDGLSLHDVTDEDWYRFQTDAADGGDLLVTVAIGGGADGSVTVTLGNAAGQPLLDGAGAPLTRTLGANQTDTLTLTDLPAGPGGYTLRFRRGVSAPDYQFTIVAPGAGADWVGDNATAAKAFPLEVAGGGAVGGLTLAAGGTDWFQVATPVLLTPDLWQLTVAAGGATLDVQVRDAGGAVVGAARGSGTLAVVYTRYGAGEGYTVVVRNPETTAAPYALRFEPAGAAAGFPLDRFALPDGAVGGNWATTGTVGIAGRQLVMSGAAGGRATWQGFTAADVGVQARFALPATGNATAAVFARTTVAVGKTTGYEGRIVRRNGVLTAQLVRLLNGAATVLGKVTLKPTLEGLVRLEAVGQRLRLLVDGHPTLQVTDSVLVPSGQAGAAGSAGVGFDDFLAGGLAAPLPVSVGDAANGAGLGVGWQSVAGAVQLKNQTLVAGGAPAVAVYGLAWLADVAVSAGYALQPGQAVGLVARVTASGTTRSYYQGKLTRAAGGTVAELIRVQGTTTTRLPLLLAAPTIPASGQLRLEVQGTVLRLLVDGATVAVARDTLLARPGQVGVALAAGTGLTGFAAHALPPLTVPASGTQVFTDDFGWPDGIAPGGGWVERVGDMTLAAGQLSGPAGGVGLAVWHGPPLSNAVVAARVDLSAAGQEVGLVARYREPLGYYEGRLTANGDDTVTAAIYRVSKGVVTLRASARWAVASSGLAQFEAVGGTLRLRFGGQTLAVTDTALTGPGLAGVVLGSEATADDFTVTAG